ncbi:MAG: hypothetical protein HN380_10745 [Victivallales bacterium]|nr:hypothetical protein [Victivallales bacterium]
MTNTLEPAENALAPSRNVLLLLAVTLGVMATQLIVPGSGGRLALADLLAGVSFLVLLVGLRRSSAKIALPAALPAVLVVYALANVFAQSSRPGVVEVAQRVEFLFCGVLILTVLLAERPQWARTAVAWALGVSLLVALVQGMTHGFGSTIAPKDVTELPLGFGGGGFTGLFRSRMALGLFIGTAVAWLQPSLIARARSWKWWLGIVAATALALGFIAHGQLLLLTAVVLVLFGFLYSWQAGLANVAALVLLALSLSVGGRGAVLSESLSPLTAGTSTNAKAKLKPGHVELIAALRLANQHPVRGIGAGDAYQLRIGTTYGTDLPPKSLKNDTETDSQSGYGILFATVGYPVGLLLVATLLAGAALGIRAFLSPQGDPMALGSSAVLVVVLGAMCFTDPFTKGNAWMVSLALAGCWGTGPVLRLGFSRVLAWCVGFAVLGGLILAAGKAEAGGNNAGQSAGNGTTVKRQPADPWDSADFGSDQFVLVVDASEATKIAKPMVKIADSQAAKQTILHIPDKTTTPPTEEAVGMKYGGATFEVEIPEDMTVKIWVRVWWDGSCGNTAYVRMGEKGKLFCIGNDGTYDEWHWVSVPSEDLKLKKGKNTLYLLNREDGVRFDQLFITDDMEYVPQYIEENEDE